jgi:hypothetical protein
MKHLMTIATTALAICTASAGNLTDCFIPGETAEYRITWMGIPIAWAKNSIDLVQEDGRELIRLRMEAKSHRAYNRVYKVDDLTDVIIDPETALPIRVDLRIHEGDRVKSHLTTFHHDQRVAIFQHRLTKDIREVPIAKDTQDVFSFVFANRNTDLKSLAAREHTIYADGKVYDLGMRILKEESVKLPGYAEVECVQLEPLAEFDGMFLRQGKIQFWVSKEKRRMLTLINAKVAVGQVSAILVSVSGPGNDFWANPKD